MIEVAVKMQEDVFPAAEKILSDIENVLKKDPNLYSFEIIPAEDNQNKSPVFHDENSLGLASWSVRPLFCHVYNRLLNLRQKKRKREEPGTVSRWLLGALLLNPDITTFWNMKRELVKSGRLDAIQELRFTNIVLFYKSKCFEAFAYRRWIIEFLLIESNRSSINVNSIIRNEIRVANMAAEKYSNNCNAWSHREYAVDLFQVLIPDDFNALIQDEWEDSKNWCNRHVSDYSGFTYRQFLLKKLLLLYTVGTKSVVLPCERIAKRRKVIFEFVKTGTEEYEKVSNLFGISYREILNLMHGSAKSKGDSDCEQTICNLSYWIEECMINGELINSYPEHEALWCHRKFLAYSLVCLTDSYNKYSIYKSESFDIQRIKPLLDACQLPEEVSLSKGILEVTFRNLNQNIIDLAKRSGDHSKSLAEKFIKYMTLINFKL